MLDTKTGLICESIKRKSHKDINLKKVKLTILYRSEFWVEYSNRIMIEIGHKAIWYYQIWIITENEAKLGRIWV